MTAERVFDANGFDQRGWHRDARTLIYCAVGPDGSVVDMCEQYHNPPFPVSQSNPDNRYAPAWGWGETGEEAAANARAVLPPGRFSVITACSRPDNLPALAEALASLPNPHGYSLEWWVIFDAPEPGPVPEVPGWTVHVLAHHAPGSWGHEQANRAMDAIGSGWVWILDDDNLPHPDMLRCRYEPGTVNLVGQQVTSETVRVPQPHAGLVDKAQIIADLSAVGDIRMPLDCFGDGRWVEALHAARPEAFRIDPAVRAYYNRLRWPS